MLNINPFLDMKLAKILFYIASSLCDCFFSSAETF